MIVYKEWDTQVIGKRAGEVVRPYKDNDWLESKNYEYLFAKIPVHDIVTIQKLEDIGFNMADISLQYMCSSPKMSLLKPDSVRPFEEHELQDLITITKNCFTHTRFHKDAYLTDAQADLIYEKWIKNACNGTYGDAVFVAHDEDNVIGYSTCRKSKLSGIIDLTAVDINNSVIRQDPGVGKLLVERDLDYFFRAGCIQIVTNIQLENYSSRSIVESLGFRSTMCIITLSCGEVKKWTQNSLL